MPFNLAIVTGHIAPGLSDGGKELAASLTARGVESEPVMWDDPSVEWDRYDGTLVRSCWDYPTDRRRFKALLDELERADLRVCNPLPVIRWNLHKSYLTALAEAGVRVPPTAVVERGTDTSLEGIAGERGWEEPVVKPAIGAGSSDVWRFSAVDDPEERFSDLVAEGDVLVQEFVPEIEAGERSIVFFDGEYSHAWNSLPANGDVTEFEGIDADYEPSPAIREEAADALRAACDLLGVESLPYARVDYVSRGTDLLLMELELIEPYLGFERGEDSVERFTEVLISYFETR